jgi:hypothetical protein
VERLERLDMSGERFVFFVDPQTRRGAVMYRRYDGHHGLVQPAEQPAAARARPVPI